MPNNASYVSALYALTQLRAPEKVAVDVWLAQPDHAVMAGALLDHPLHAQHLTGLDDVSFVRALYQYALDDVAEPAGEAFWLGALASGTPRAQVVAGFVQAVLAYDGGTELGLQRQAVLQAKADKGWWFMQAEHAVQDLLTPYQHLFALLAQHEQLASQFDPDQLAQQKLALHEAAQPHLPPYLDINDKNLQLVFDAHDLNLRLAQSRLDDIKQHYPALVNFHRAVDRYQLHTQQLLEAQRWADAEMQKVAVLNGIAAPLHTADYQPLLSPQTIAKLKGQQAWMDALQGLDKKQLSQSQSWNQVLNTSKKLAKAFAIEVEPEQLVAPLGQGTLWVDSSGQMTPELIQHVSDYLWQEQRPHHYGQALTAQQQAKTALHHLTSTLKQYEQTRDLQKALLSLEQAIATTRAQLTEKAAPVRELGLNPILTEEAEVWASTAAKSAPPDLFIYAGQSLQVDGLGASPSLFYLGRDVVPVWLDATQRSAVGDVATPEVFIQQVANDTHLYLEQQPFAGSSSVDLALNRDVVTVILSGVVAQDLLWENGFLQLASL